MARINKKILKAAVIGCGRIGALTIHTKGDDLPKRYFPTNHCAAIRSTKGIKLAAVCDENLIAARKAAKLHKVKNTYTDFKKMIIKESPDIISIATRMAGRSEIISFAADHGVKGMHIEKPLANNLKKTKEIIKILEKNNIAVSYGTVRRYMPIYRQAKKILDSGKFGKLKEIIINIPKSQLMWGHPHTIDLINYFTDNAEVDYVKSSFGYDKKNVSKNKINMDPIVDFGLIKFKNGVSGLLEDNGGEDVKLVCEKGEIIIQIGGKNLKIKNIGGKIRNIRIREGKSGRCEAIAELRDFINYEKPTSITTEELLTEQKVLLALGLSGITDKKVRLSEIKNNFTITGRFNNLYP